MLISAEPKTSGKKAVLARSRQLTDFKWTPLENVPTYTKELGETVLPKGIEVVGMPYCSMESTDRFLWENLSFETFVSLVQNPQSALYTKNQGGAHDGRAFTFCGIVCNGLVRYSLNIRPRYNTNRWQDIYGMRKTAQAGEYTAEDIQLCDVLHAFGNGRNHVALITDILRDENGVIRKIEVSEACRPLCKRVSYDTEEYFEKYKLFSLWRYEFVDTVPEPNEYQDLIIKKGVPVELPTIAVDYGNKSYYNLGEETVISFFGDGRNEIEISCDGVVSEKLGFDGKGSIKRTFDRGYYTVTNKATDACLEFCVLKHGITHTVKDGYITVNAEPCDKESKILYMDFRGKGTLAGALCSVEILTEQEIRSGVITRKIPDEAENFKIYFENKYGIWSHRMIKI